MSFISMKLFINQKKVKDKHFQTKPNNLCQQNFLILKGPGRQCTLIISTDRKMVSSRSAWDPAQKQQKHRQRRWFWGSIACHASLKVYPHNPYKSGWVWQPPYNSVRRRQDHRSLVASCGFTRETLPQWRNWRATPNATPRLGCPPPHTTCMHTCIHTHKRYKKQTDKSFGIQPVDAYKTLGLIYPTLQ